MEESAQEQAIRFGDDGLVPCVVQDLRTGEVLTLAYMNAEALGLTLETREVHFWSRSRQELWRKGETSGNTLALDELRVDCDGDALVALVTPAGPACHTGERSCFFRDAESGARPAPALHETLAALERTLRSRQAERPQGSYTVELLDEPGLISAKVLEEAEEVTRAAREEPDDRVAAEAADVLYHLAVLLRSRDVAVADVLKVLDERRG
ncbi:MAG: bifunctional phosphoribosyl-AMP cyclohydrolase/phosphoribosyl-ATP diphosphatase HisIE [Actinomycetota bacterium]|nr:bifunctional phosphoribosyl-AMP cyclohydrolase/phosphoribosyl-ATP diphosphatase HisIE [Actinomycetota bacterium]